MDADLLIVIPARLASTRYPNKPLALAWGEPVIRHVVYRAREAFPSADLVVATDARGVAAAVDGLCEVFMSGEASCGTDRAAQVARERASRPRWVLNVQGDEPCVPVDALLATLASLQQDTAPMATASIPMTTAEGYEDPDVVKVVAALGRARYFSRSPIPHHRAGVSLRWCLHVGVYGFTYEGLMAFEALGPSGWEQAEGLEQLRALEGGMEISVASLDGWIDRPWPALNRPADLAEVEAWLRSA